MADITINANAPSNGQIFGRPGIVWISPLIGYMFLKPNTDELSYQKTTDGGQTWGSAVKVTSNLVYTACVVASVWYDRWTPGDSGTKIHIVQMCRSGLGTVYRALDTATDTFGTQVLISTLSGGAHDYEGCFLSLTKSRGGNLYAAFHYYYTPGQFYRSVDGGANWTSRATALEIHFYDGYILVPGGEADTNDCGCVYLDASVNELTYKVYDNSADSWSESGSSVTCVGNYQFILFSAEQRHSDNHIIVAYLNAYDSATADLKIWDITNLATQTSKTNVLTDSAETVSPSIVINQINGDLYVFYARGTAIGSALKVFYKKSTNGGSTWGSEQAFTEGAESNIIGVWTCSSIGVDGGRIIAEWYNHYLYDIITNYANSIEIPVGVTTYRIKPIPAVSRVKPVFSPNREKPVII